MSIIKSEEILKQELEVMVRELIEQYQEHRKVVMNRPVLDRQYQKAL